MAELPDLGEHCQVESCQQIGKTLFIAYSFVILKVYFIYLLNNDIQGCTVICDISF